MPDAVGAHHVPALVDQDVEGQTGFLDVVANGVTILRQDTGDLDSARCIRADVLGKLTEPVAALRSPGAAMEVQQQSSAGQEIHERARAALLVGHHESWRRGQW
jgi:hypothetical protein